MEYRNREEGAVERRRRAGAFALATLGATLLLVTAVAFSSTNAAQRVATNAEALHWANGMLGYTEISWESVGATLSEARLEEEGAATPEDVAAAADATRLHLDEVSAWRDGAGNPGGDLDAAVSEYLATAGQTLALITTGDLAAASETRVVQLAPRRLDLVELGTARQDEVASAIAVSEAAAGRVAGVLRWLLLLVIPALAMLGYRRYARKKLREQAIRSASELGAQREVSRAKEDLLAGLSHQLRTPLTGIVGIGDLLRDDPEIPVLQRDLIGTLHTEATELTRLVEDALAFTRLSRDAGPAPIRTIAVRPLLRELCDDASGIGHYVELDCPPAFVLGAAIYIPHVIRNLLSNARRHGGPTTKLTGIVAGEWFEITVADDGPGVDPEIVGHLFEPFVNHGNRALLAGSLGMGLAVARGLVERMGGELEYTRVEGWSEFRVRLGLAPGFEEEHGWPRAMVGEEVGE